MTSSSHDRGIELSSSMAGKEEELAEKKNGNGVKGSTCDPCRSFGQKCSHLVKKQRARFYIVRRCVAMLLCWHEHKDR